VWTTKSTKKLASALSAMGHRVSDRSRWTIEKVMPLSRGNGSLATVGVYDDELVVVFDTRPDGRRNSVVRIAHIKL